MYSTFTDQQVFLNADVNVFCNLIYEELIKSADLATIQANFAMINTLAAIIDGAPLEELTVVTFATKNTELYEEMKLNLGQRLGTVTVSFPDRIQMIWNNIFFEFWYKPAMVIKTVNDLQIEDLDPPA